jgi:deoxyxylulose-5-phosphate synthase
VHVPLLKVALGEGFVHHGAVDDLRRQQRIDAAGIAAQIRDALGLEAPAMPAEPGESASASAA